MPLHLLHHKSWNVYSTKNVEKVRRDEAEAAAAAEAEATRLAAQDATHRLDILRARAAGQAEPPPAAVEDTIDTMHDDNEAGSRKRQRTTQDHHLNRVGLTGKDGHINLFPEKPKKAEKNQEYEAEKRAKEEKWEAQNLGNALGKPADELTPWYSALDMVGEKQKEREKNERRTEWTRIKEERRKDWADPLAVMKHANRKVKEVEDERREWKRMREKEVGADTIAPALIDRNERPRLPDRARARSRERTAHESRERTRHRSRSRDRKPDRERHRRHHRSSSSRGHRRKRSRSESPPRSRHRRHTERPAHDAALERLRADAQRRETAERRKTEELLKKERAAQVPGWQAVQGGIYSSQFGIGEVRHRHP